MGGVSNDAGGCLPDAVVGVPTVGRKRDPKNIRVDTTLRDSHPYDPGPEKKNNESSNGV